jgi:hypothetical protein
MKELKEGKSRKGGVSEAPTTPKPEGHPVAQGIVAKQEDNIKSDARQGFFLQDLIKQLKQKEELKTALETEFYKVIGQIQLLTQQIEALKEKK